MLFGKSNIDFPLSLVDVAVAVVIVAVVVGIDSCGCCFCDVCMEDETSFKWLEKNKNIEIKFCSERIFPLRSNSIITITVSKGNLWL